MYNKKIGMREAERKEKRMTKNFKPGLQPMMMPQRKDKEMGYEKSVNQRKTKKRKPKLQMEREPLYPVIPAHPLDRRLAVNHTALEV
jgi:hypothetical protein